MSASRRRQRRVRSKEQRIQDRERERERERKAKALTRTEIETELREKLAVSLWPITGRAFELSRPTTYEEAKKGNIPTIDVGKLKKVPSSWVRQKLGLEVA